MLSLKNFIMSESATQQTSGEVVKGLDKNEDSKGPAASLVGHLNFQVVRVFIEPVTSDRVIPPQADLLLAVYFPFGGKFSFQEGIGKGATRLHVGYASPGQTVLPLQGKHPLPLSGWNYDPGHRPMCLLLEEGKSAYYIYGDCSYPDHVRIRKSTVWLDSEGYVLYWNHYHEGEPFIITIPTWQGS